MKQESKLEKWLDRLEHFVERIQTLSESYQAARKQVIKMETGIDPDLLTLWLKVTILSMLPQKWQWFVFQLCKQAPVGARKEPRIIQKANCLSKVS
jgi:hypothetical protein